jgi:hypothetical protein
MIDRFAVSAARRPRGARRSTRVAALSATAAILLGAIGVPASAASPGVRSELTGQRIGQTLGAGIHVDARSAARAAALDPRPTRAAPEMRIDSRLGPSTTAPHFRAPNLASGGVTAASGQRRSPDVILPAPKVTTSFPGITEPEACGCEPPDPWMAVSSTYVLQSVNGLVRITTRTGAELLSIPTWALFAVPGDRFDANPRILWDTVHARWIGVISTYKADFSEDGLRFAVSETSNPLGGWTVYSIETAFYLADSPGIASSASEVLLTADLFDTGATYFGAIYYVIDWSDILAGRDLYLGGLLVPGPQILHFRPAVMLSSAPNIPMIYQRLDEAAYIEITGNAHTQTAVNQVNLSTILGIDPLSTPPAATQPGPVTISNIGDGGPTNAIFRNGALWFASTFDYFDGVAHWDAARYTQILTTANNTPISIGVDIPAFTSGTDYFAAGIGINVDGTAFLTATQSDGTSTYPTTVVAVDRPIDGITSYQPIESSTNAYTGSRWGGYIGIASDPSGVESVWMAHELAAASGGWRTSVVRLTSDGYQPTTPTAIRETVLPPATLGATVPVRISWGAAADPGSGVTGYFVSQAIDGGPFHVIGAASPGTSTVRPLSIGHAYRFQVVAVDGFGNISAALVGPTFTPTVYQQTSHTTYSGTWTTSTSSSYSGGTTKQTSTAGRSATFTATNARSIAIVTAIGTARGSFKVYVDGVYKATVSTYSATNRYRRIVYSYSWSSAGTHKIKIVVKGTAHHPRVDLDGFIVLR